MSYLVGLTGGIGSGKSTVAEMFAALGVPIIDTDLIAHQLTQADGKAIPAIRNTFGEQALDTSGALDRNTMRKIIFSDSDKKKQLESILHPLILLQTKQLAAPITDASYTLIIVPLLFESPHYATWLDHTVTVDSTEDAQIARTMQRSGLDEPTVRSIMAQQLSRTERLDLTDDVIHNNGSLENLRDQVAAIHPRLCSLAMESH